MYFFQGKKYIIALQGANVEWHWRMNTLLSFPLSNLPPYPLSPELPVVLVEIFFATSFQFKIVFSPILRQSLFSFLHKYLFPGVFAPANLVNDSKTYKHAHIYGYTHFLNTQTYKYDTSMFFLLIFTLQVFSCMLSVSWGMGNSAAYPRVFLWHIQCFHDWILSN